MIRRRQFITVLGGAAAWPVVGRAQQLGKVWRIGFIAGGARPVPLDRSPFAGFLQGMREMGYVEGRDFTMEWRFAEARYELFPDFAAEFARLKVDVVVTTFAPAAHAMRQTNPSIPIVLAYSTDPVAQGLVASLARPGGNITGLASALDEIAAKQVDLLITAVPKLSRLTLLTNPGNAANQIVAKSVEAAARQAGVDLLRVKAESVQEIAGAFDTAMKDGGEAIIVAVDALFFGRRQQLAELALTTRLPSIFPDREYAEAGGLMSYGNSIREFSRLSATFVDKIFKGAKPADLPIEQPTKFKLVINRKTADVLGLAIPPSLYIFADEVIE
jgi:putative ABC transport system substrate-binding protein